MKNVQPPPQASERINSFPTGGKDQLVPTKWRTRGLEQEVVDGKWGVDSFGDVCQKKGAKEELL